MAALGALAAFEQFCRVFGLIMNVVGVVQIATKMIPGEEEHDRIGKDSEVRIYAALLDQVAFRHSLGVDAATSTAPALAAFNKLGDCIGVTNTVFLPEAA